jgi:hypothetical protein
MPEGAVFFDVAKAASFAASVYTLKGGVVIKTNKGHSGAGVLIFKKGDLSGAIAKDTGLLLTKLNAEQYWSKFPIVVEDYVELDESISGGSPSIEYRVGPDGQAECLYPCAMRVNADGVFQGVEISAEALPLQVLAAMHAAGRYVAGEYSRNGYRGYFDIDFVLSKDGTCYVGESNVRRTGGTHAYHLGRFLLGDDFLNNSYIIANNCCPLPVCAARGLSFSRLLEVLGPVAYHAGRREGVILTSAHKLSQGQIAYAIIHKDRSRALGLESRMFDLLNGV